MTLEQGEGRVDLAVVVRLDLAVQFVQRLDGLVGVVLHRQDGDGHARPAFDEAMDVGCGLEAAGEQQARDVGIGRGKTRGEAREDDVGTVAGRDDEAALRDVVEEVADLHGGDDVVVHQRVEATVPVEHLCAEPLLDVVHGGLAEGGLFGEHVHGERVRAVDLALEALDDLFALGFGDGGAVDDRRDHVEALLVEKVDGQLRRGDELTGGLLLAVGHHHDGAAEVGGDVGVEFELERGILAEKVGALAEHEIVGVFELLVLLEDVVQKGGVLTVVD